MLLCACMSISVCTGVQAADFSSGDSDSKVEIEFQEEDDSTDKTESEDAEDGLFSDGSDDIQTGELSAIANRDRSSGSEPGTGLPDKEAGSPEGDRCP